MSYPTQWTSANIAPQGAGISPQGDVIQNAAIFNHFNSGAPLRQPAPPMQIQLNQAHPTQNSAGYCPTAPGGYSFVYPALMAAFAAQSGAVQSRQTSGFCVPQGNSQSNAAAAAAAAAALRGTALLSPPTAFQPPPPPPAQHPLAHLQYFPPLNGIQLAAAFPGASSTASFPNTSSLTQQHAAALPTPQFRGYDSLKHFGALPQTMNHKRNKSMTTSKTNLYISGLSESDTDESVRALVEDVVRPKSCKAMLLNGKCKGSGFIDCATEEDAIKALNHLSEMAKNGGRKLNVKYALENEKDLLNVYVRNLPKTGFTKETLENLFRPYGIGFVRFASADQAQRAVESMNERRYVLTGGNGNGDSSNDNGSAKPICCKLADKADPKRRAAATAAATGSIPSGHNPSSSAVGLSRPKFHHHQRHHQPAQQQLVPGELHLQSHHQQPLAAHTVPNQQIPHGLIYQPVLIKPFLSQVGMLPDGANMIATAICSPPAAGYAPPPNPPSSCYPAARPADPHEVSRSTSTGLLEMPTPQSPPTDLLPAVNGHSPAGAATGIDSRYAVQFAAAVAASQLPSTGAVSNAVMYSPSNAVVAASQFSRPTQPLVQPTYSTSYTTPGNGAGHYAAQGGQPIQPCSNLQNPSDLLAEQLQSLSLAARQSHHLYPDWSAAGYHVAPVTTAAYQLPMPNEAYLDSATTALLGSYVQLPPRPPQATENSDQEIMRDNAAPGKEDRGTEQVDPAVAPTETENAATSSS
ncbi:unnamed protein product [Mesocestoides corti]|uniref:RRM domain-containing protein n=1 Tax=Mesocestoides corti TaxID=53468 RepID=A0A0R3ULC9_MESCO|nr:unnamed protein product [Mesocestoides corti]